MTVYLGEWESAEDVSADFGIEANALEGANIIVAAYDCECYEGYAFVLFERDDKLYEVNGSHCSCYGLSENDISGSTGTQWQPEEVSREVLASGRRYFYGSSDVQSAITAYLESTK